MRYSSRRIVVEGVGRRAGAAERSGEEGMTGKEKEEART